MKNVSTDKTGNYALLLQNIVLEAWKFLLALFTVPDNNLQKEGFYSLL